MFPHYPKTYHLADSRLPPGNENQVGLWEVPFERVLGHHLVIEEKVDGSQAGILFDGNGDLVVFSRGSLCPRNQNFGPLWLWVEQRQDNLFDVLGDRYILYAEWAALCHTIYYDALPAFFLEDDVYDSWEEEWLSTAARRTLLKPLRASCGLVSVPVLHEGQIDSLEALKSFVGPSAFKSKEWVHAMVNKVRQRKIPVEETLEWLDPSTLMEGLYIKVEKEGRVTGRLKWVRYDFLQTILNSSGHWNKRPPLPNQLKKS